MKPEDKNIAESIGLSLANAAFSDAGLAGAYASQAARLTALVRDNKQTVAGESIRFAYQSIAAGYLKDKAAEQAAKVNTEATEAAETASVDWTEAAKASAEAAKAAEAAAIVSRAAASAETKAAKAAKASATPSNKAKSTKAAKAAKAAAEEWSKAATIHKDLRSVAVNLAASEMKAREHVETTGNDLKKAITAATKRVRDKLNQALRRSLSDLGYTFIVSKGHDMSEKTFSFLTNAEAEKAAKTEAAEAVEAAKAEAAEAAEAAKAAKAAADKARDIANKAAADPKISGEDGIALTREYHDKAAEAEKAAKAETKAETKAAKAETKAAKAANPKAKAKAKVDTEKTIMALLSGLNSFELDRIAEAATKAAEAARKIEAAEAAALVVEAA